MDPGLVGAWYNKGVALKELGRYAEAIGCYDKTLGIYPKNANAWFTKGVTLVKLGKPQEAMRCFQQVIELAPLQDASLVEQAKKIIIRLKIQNK
jgi:tetratricopeptide (TPR) repeat protein